MKTGEMFAYWNAVREGLCQALDRISDAQLDFTPRAGLWSLRKTVCHIAEAEEGWFRYCVNRAMEDWPEFSDASYPTIASLKGLITPVHQRTEQYFAQNGWVNADEMMNNTVELPWGERTSLGWITWHVLEHEIHHRGEIYLMLGLMGIEAPDV